MDNSKYRAGFTLIEMAVVLVVIGIFIGFAVRLIIPGVEVVRVSNTEQRLEALADRLAAFAIKNNRLPCPATPDGSGTSPFGYEIDSGSNGADPDTTCVDDNAEGIIPFMTLGIPQEQIRDGWGRFITYRISPVFGLDLDSVPASQYDEVHLACRNFNWFSRSNSNNLNAAKARFCCPPRGLSSGSDFYPTTDIEMRDGNGDLLWSATRTTDTDQYDNVNTRITNIDDIDSTLNPDVLANEAIAFVLVSHGKNAYGAFNGATTTSRFATTSQSGANENENQDSDNIFIAQNNDKTQDNTYFDDIVLWRTQHQLFTEFGENTCLNP